MRQTILHSITDIMAAAAAVDVMDMDKEKDKDRRKSRSAESVWFAVPGSGRVATKFRPALWQRPGWDRSVSAGKAADAKTDGHSNQQRMPNRAGNVSGDVILRMTDCRQRNNHEVHEQEY